MKVACVAVKCVGFDRETYEGLQKHASRKGDDDLSAPKVLTGVNSDSESTSRSSSSMASRDSGGRPASAAPTWDGGLSSNGSIWNSKGGLGNGELVNLMGKLRIQAKSLERIQSGLR